MSKVIVKLEGKVISAKMDKTRLLETTRTFRVKKYEKVVKLRKKFMFHDEKNESKFGDIVEVIFSRPKSRRKRWNLNRIIKKAKEYIV